VLDRERPVLLVSREDGPWCFLCGGDDHEQTAKDFKAVGLVHILEMDASLATLLDDLEPDWEAERSSVNSAWERSKLFPGQELSS
jgi:hypothetical protein